ncbi:MAG: DNA repair exonuclease [Candidatus Methanoplasma sp.]|jgi:DNA repair exonuclease SbcCD nuclease subunit|nr:DNA repair exonuclease [Candidatus Methanoplasma sp.]
MGTELKFIHCADLHLGSRFKGISDKDAELGHRLTEAVFSSFGRIVDLAISEKADLLVISGDVFDEENETPSTRYRFAKELERLDIPCMIALGNHDHKRSWESSIPYPENVHVFPSSPDRQVIRVNNIPVEVLGRSFPSRHTGENLAQSLKGSPHMFTIAVVHCDLDPATNSPYAPCRLSEILNNNVDYWALGHIHERNVVCEHPSVVYPGNIQGRNSKESGEKGAYVVTVSGGSVSEIRFVPTQDILWTDIETDIGGKDLGSFINSIKSASSPGSIISLRISGRGELDAVLRLHPDETVAQISSATGCIVSSVELLTGPAIDLGSVSKNNGLVSKMMEAAQTIGSLPRGELISRICSTRLSADIRDVFEEMSDDELKLVVRDAEMLLIEKLTEAYR